jgi:hypothetical protein
MRKFIWVLMVLLMSCGSPAPTGSSFFTQDTRPADLPGYVLPAPIENGIFTSTHVIDIFDQLMMVDNPWAEEGTFVLDPDSLYSWDQVPFDNPNIHTFIYKPGNYTQLGILKITRSGTSTQPVVHQPFEILGPHPVLLSVDNQAVLENFELWGASHHIFHKLVFRGISNERDNIRGGRKCIIRESDHNVVSQCVIEQFLDKAGIDLINSSFNSIQNTVIREKIRNFGFDSGGIAMNATAGRESRGNWITGNEIYNVTDAVGMVYHGPNDTPPELWRTGEFPATVIENNDFYVAPDFYEVHDDLTYACAENALDIKQGTSSTDPADRILILNNRCWGYRPTWKPCGGSGAKGDVFTIHLQAKNILFAGNILMDSPSWFSIYGKNKNHPEAECRDIYIQNNLMVNVFSEPGNITAGLAMTISAQNVKVYQNTILHANRLLNAQKKWNPEFSCNVFADVPDLGDYTKFYPEQIPDVLPGFITDHLSDLTIIRKRLTGPEQITIKEAIPTTDSDYYTISSQPCSCNEPIDCLL